MRSTRETRTAADVAIAEALAYEIDACSQELRKACDELYGQPASVEYSEETQRLAVEAILPRLRYSNGDPSILRVRGFQLAQCGGSVTPLAVAVTMGRKEVYILVR